MPRGPLGRQKHPLRRHYCLHLIPCFALALAVLCFSYCSVVAGDDETRDEGRPVTVADTIDMTRVVWGSTQFSPDKSRFVVVVRKGNLTNNTNEYSLMLWRTSDVLHPPRPDVLVTLGSSSNRGAITDVTWMNNDTLVFLGEHPNEVHQLYKFDIRTRRLKQIINHSTNIISYSVASGGSRIAYAAEKKRENLLDDRARRRGVLVSSQYLSRLLAGERGASNDEGTSQLFFQSGVGVRRLLETRCPRFADRPLYLSPDGRYLAVRTLVEAPPQNWTDYQDPM